MRSTGGTTTGTRYYSHAGEVIGVRTSAGLTWLINDHQGTAWISVNAATQAVTVRRQKPFGEPRGPAVTWTGDRGFVGGTNDPTGTVHLGAREYDPSTGRFVSADPVVDTGDPQQMHGYGYGNSSPVTMSDPDGLRPMEGVDGDVPKRKPKPSACTGSCATYRDYYTEKARGSRPIGPVQPGRGCDSRTWHCPRGSKPVSLTSSRRYPYGTELRRYEDGTITINHLVLPPGYSNPEELAAAVDRTLAALRKLKVASPHPLVGTAEALAYVCVHGVVYCGEQFRRNVLETNSKLHAAFPEPIRNNWWDRHGDGVVGVAGLVGLGVCFFVTGGICAVISGITLAAGLGNSAYAMTRDGEITPREVGCFMIEAAIGAATSRLPPPINTVPWDSTSVQHYTLGGALNVGAEGVGQIILAKACAG